MCSLRRRDHDEPSRERGLGELLAHRVRATPPLALADRWTNRAELLASCLYTHTARPGCSNESVALTDLCRRVAKAPAYYSLNPGLFDSVEHWKYRDLQRLSKTLGLSGGGRRQDVVDRLLSYHRGQRGSGQAGMFHSVEVKANDCGAAINPVLLSPLRPERMKSDDRSALSTSKLAAANAANAESSPRYRDCGEGACAPTTPKRTPARTPARSPLTPRGNGTVLFSPVRHAHARSRKPAPFVPGRPLIAEVRPASVGAVQHGQADPGQGALRDVRPVPRAVLGGRRRRGRRRHQSLNRGRRRRGRCRETSRHVGTQIRDSWPGRCAGLP